MKKTAALLAGLLALAGWTSAAAQPSGDGDPGSPRYCQAQWSAMQKAGTAGDQSRAALMDRCVTQHADPGDYHQLALVGALATGIVFSVLQPSHEHPASP